MSDIPGFPSPFNFKVTPPVENANLVAPPVENSAPPQKLTLKERKAKQFAILGFTDLPDGVSGDTFINVVNAAYTAYTEAPSEPLTLAALRRFSGHTEKTVMKVMATEQFNTALAKRGIQLNKQAGLSTEQMLVLQVILNPVDKRDLNRKLKSAGVTYGRYRSWLKQPLFLNYLNQQAEGLLIEHQSDVLVALTQKATQGDIKGISMFLEITGRHNPAQQQNIDSQAMLLRVIEIITRNVKDPVTLKAISDEFATLGATPHLNATQTIRGVLA